MFGRNKNAPIEKIETVIGANTNFRGRLVCDGSIRIDGICEEGSIETTGNIVVSPQAKVAADLIAANVSVSGAVTGKITATGRLEILSTGKVWGDVDAGSFLLDQEGYFNGKLVTKEDVAPPEIGQGDATNGSEPTDVEGEEPATAVVEEDDAE